MATTIYLLVLILMTADSPPAERTIVALRLDGRQLKFAGGVGTRFEGLAIAFLGSCTTENGPEVANKERWEKALSGDHVRVTFAKPRLFSVTGDESDLYAQEILVPNPRKSPDHIFVRNGDRYRAFAKYHHETAEAFRKHLERLLPLSTAK